MRIAVSGTHCTGKSTLIDEFLRVHPDFVHEPEPYTVLVEELGEEFSAEPCVEDFQRQLEFNIDSTETARTRRASDLRALPDRFSRVYRMRCARQTISFSMKSSRVCKTSI